jgi:hypothetical protein
VKARCIQQKEKSLSHLEHKESTQKLQLVDLPVTQVLLPFFNKRMGFIPPISAFLHPEVLTSARTYDQAETSHAR